MTHPHLFPFQIKEFREAMKAFWLAEIEKWFKFLWEREQSYSQPLPILPQ